ncbi:MAG: FAD-binding oxidoreductase [Pseudomonadota bacterium]
MRRREFGQRVAAGLACFAAPSLGRATSSPPDLAERDGVIVDAAAANASELSDPFNRRWRRIPRRRALCATAEGVRTVLNWARETEEPFSVRSGGHCFAGYSEASDLVIDLRRMRRVVVSPTAGTVSVDAGARVQDVIDALAPLDLAVPAGYCQTVGFGGHALGGGVGYLARAYGTLADSLLEVEMITADGRLLTVRPDENAELFWACQGGGYGFGVATRFVFRTRPLATAHHGRVLTQVAPDHAAAILGGWREILRDAPQEFSSIAYFSGVKADLIQIRIALVSVGELRAFQRLLDQIRELTEWKGSFVRTNEAWRDVSHQLWPRDRVGHGRYAIKSGFADDSFGASGWRALIEGLYPGVSGFCQMQGGAIDALSSEATAFPHRGPAAQLCFQWDVRLDDGDGSAPGREAQLTSAYRRMGPFLTGGAYANYRDRSLANWAEAYWGQNTRRLRAVKRRYDPENIFSGPQVIAPA